MSKLLTLKTRQWLFAYFAQKNSENQMLGKEFMITPQHTNIMTGPHTWSLSAYCCLEDSVSWHVLFYESFIFCRIAVRYNAHLSPRATIIVTCFALSQMHDMHLVTRSSLRYSISNDTLYVPTNRRQLEYYSLSFNPPLRHAERKMARIKAFSP